MSTHASGQRDTHHRIRQAAIASGAFVLSLIFGVILLISGDWIPGGIIVVAALIGLAVQVPVIRRLCRQDSTPSVPRGRPTA